MIALVKSLNMEGCWAHAIRGEFSEILFGYKSSILVVGKEKWWYFFGITDFFFYMKSAKYVPLSKLDSRCLCQSLVLNKKNHTSCERWENSVLGVCSADPEVWRTVLEWLSDLVPQSYVRSRSAWTFCPSAGSRRVRPASRVRQRKELFGQSGTRPGFPSLKC